MNGRRGGVQSVYIYQAESQKQEETSAASMLRFVPIAFVLATWIHSFVQPSSRSLIHTHIDRPPDPSIHPLPPPFIPRFLCIEP